MDYAIVDKVDVPAGVQRHAWGTWVRLFDELPEGKAVKFVAEIKELKTLQNNLLASLRQGRRQQGGLNGRITTRLVRDENGGASLFIWRVRG